MKTTSFELSEYYVALNKFLNLTLKPKEIYDNYRRMQEIEELILKQDDKIEIIITTTNTQNHLID